MIGLALILDALLPEMACAERSSSLLTLPLGRRTLLDEIAARVARLPGGEGLELVVHLAKSGEEAYRQNMRRSSGRPVRLLEDPAGPRDGQAAGAIAAWVQTLPPNERVLVLDASRWPAADFNLAALLRRYEGDEAIVHLIGTGAVQPRARERVERDAEGQVTRVQRLYDAVAAAEASRSGTFASLVPAGVLRNLRFGSLSELRLALQQAEAGGAEVSAPLEVLDLRRLGGLLALNERALADELARGGAAVSNIDQAQVMLGRGCQIHERARLVGPLILHDNVIIDAGATVVGPTVIGAGSAVEVGALVVQAVLGAGTRVRSGVTLRHCVAAGTCLAWSTEACAVAEPLRISPGPSRPIMPWRRGPSPEAPLDKRRRLHFAIKRLMDITVSAIGLIVLSPLLLVVAMLIKATSPGPVFFMHRREQREGKEFSCIKFRTMVPNADALQNELRAKNELDGPQFKMQNDPRVTRLGAFLRATNIDELPQLINVLCGHMSLVGPRPSPFRENQICVPWRRARLSVRPGITGLWQICRSPDRSAGDFHEWIFYDIAYVRHFSIWLDLKILFATLWTRGGRVSLPMSRLIGEERARAPFAQRHAVT
jgi:lipopolysaccharide/colanic/teichoic acid biosynthesis glycosyltransferase/NDP-sugar pyrophosphorylase family protein